MNENQVLPSIRILNARQFYGCKIVAIFPTHWTKTMYEKRSEANKKKVFGECEFKCKGT